MKLSKEVRTKLLLMVDCIEDLKALEESDIARLNLKEYSEAQIYERPRKTAWKEGADNK